MANETQRVQPGSAAEAGLTPAEKQRVREFAKAVQELRAHLGERIVGQEAIVTLLLTAILAEGHCLLVGVPGLAKTLLVRSLAELLSISYKRIQFTPDLMPSDITGASIIHEDSGGSRDFRFLRGPIFANIILADEINRTPPKTQAALMEAMEEGQISVAGRRTPLERPFFVLATQNPIEQEGTYPLPVSQLDRFLFSVTIDYPTEDEEFEILVRTTSTYQSELRTLFERDTLLELLNIVPRIQIAPRWIDYASSITRCTRPSTPEAPEFIRDYVSWGAGPRATQALLSGAKASALLAGRDHVEVEDLHAVVLPAYRHRVLLSYHAQAEGMLPDDVLVRLLRSLPDGLYPPAAEDTPARKKGLLARLFG